MSEDKEGENIIIPDSGEEALERAEDERRSAELAYNPEDEAAQILQSEQNLARLMQSIDTITEPYTIALGVKALQELEGKKASRKPFRGYRSRWYYKPDPVRVGRSVVYTSELDFSNSSTRGVDLREYRISGDGDRPFNLRLKFANSKIRELQLLFPREQPPVEGSNELSDFILMVNSRPFFGPSVKDRMWKMEIDFTDRPRVSTTGRFVTGTYYYTPGVDGFKYDPSGSEVEFGSEKFLGILKSSLGLIPIEKG